MTDLGTAVSDLTLRALAAPAPLRHPRMANAEEPRSGLALSSRGLCRNGSPWIPVSGEMHYSRVPRERWARRLRQMVAGGITVVATYVPWIHHAPDGERARFDGNLDIAAFVDLAREAGLDVVLRIGPWVHGEIRNGGFPDWVQSAPVAHRTDDAAYLALVRGWWMQLAHALDGRCRPDVVLGIQLENELYDQPGHLLTLKQLARECGMTAPLWTATAWGGADLPDEEVFPLYGGYADGFWVDPDAPWDPTFREHFFFSDVWDDPGIGADVRGGEAGSDRVGLSTWFPPATCELGGGMATAYHRRPVPTGRDIAAVGHCKIGNGSAWQGFFMYAGGTNPGRDLQESHATGYPNDMPQLTYDFHAPVGEAGRLGSGHAPLRIQNTFLASFGPTLGGSTSTLPEERPSGVHDDTTLRWAFRGGPAGGFVCIAWHQPHVPLQTYRGARFRLPLEGGEVRFPSMPVDIPAGTLARWPVRLPFGGMRIEWLTASPVTHLPGTVPTLVVLAEAGVPVEIALPSDARVAGAVERGPATPSAQVWHIEPSTVPLRISSQEGAFHLVVVPAAYSERLWVPLDSSGAAQRVLLSSDELGWGAGAELEAWGEGAESEVWDYRVGEGFARLPMVRAEGFGERDAVSASLVREAAPVNPDGYGSRDGRPSAPSVDVIATRAARYRLDLPERVDDPDACLEIVWAGDVGDIRVDGIIVADRFWDGSVWKVNCRDAGIHADAEVILSILPLAREARVHLPEAAQSRREASRADLCALDSVHVTRRARWQEVPAR